MTLAGPLLLKHDGFRALAYVESGSCRLISRKQIVYKSKLFVSLGALLAKLPVQDAILDGELVCLDADGRSQFMDLMRRRKAACFYAFDLIWCNTTDLRQLPLLERKRQLRQLVHKWPGILYADHLRGAAVELFRLCCAAGSGGRCHQSGARTVQRSATIMAQGDQSQLFTAPGSPGDVRQVPRAPAPINCLLIVSELGASTMQPALPALLGPHFTALRLKPATRIISTLKKLAWRGCVTRHGTRFIRLSNIGLRGKRALPSAGTCRGCQGWDANHIWAAFLDNAKKATYAEDSLV